MWETLMPKLLRNVVTRTRQGSSNTCSQRVPPRGRHFTIITAIGIWLCVGTAKDTPHPTRPHSSPIGIHFTDVNMEAWSSSVTRSGSHLLAADVNVVYPEPLVPETHCLASTRCKEATETHSHVNCVLSLTSSPWTENWIKHLLSMAPPLRKRPSFPLTLSHQEASKSLYHSPSEGRQNENHNYRKLIKLITWTTALSNSVKLWVMPCRVTQDGQVIVESSDKMWSTGEGNDKPLQYSCLENPMNSMKRQKDRTLKDEFPRSVGAQYATGKEWRNNSRKNEDLSMSISKANHSIPQESKSMPQPVMLKKLKLNGSMKTYKTF